MTILKILTKFTHLQGQAVALFKNQALKKQSILFLTPKSIEPFLDLALTTQTCQFNVQKCQCQHTIVKIMS